MKKILEILIPFALLLFGLTTIVVAAEQAIVTTKTIYPGQIINSADLKAVTLKRGAKAPYPFISQSDRLIGKEASRTILPNRYIQLDAARVPNLIKAGQIIRVQLVSGGLSISIDSMALENGSVGQSIRLRNPASGKTFSGVVQNDKSVVAGAI